VAEGIGRVLESLPGSRRGRGHANGRGLVRAGITSDNIQLSEPTRWESARIHLRCAETANVALLWSALLQNKSASGPYADISNADQFFRNVPGADIAGVGLNPQMGGPARNRRNSVKQNRLRSFSPKRKLSTCCELRLLE
jgi:hypothetical protein